jgi:predicted AlkP superfamily phosphohydrolase/phosphomutase
MSKVFVFGMDGATFDLILPWAEQGLLPNFSKLLADGSWGPLESVPSMRSPAAWTTFLTGKNPGKHGLYEFYEPIPGTYDVRFVNGGMRQAASVWSLLSAQGKRVGVINVPMSYPAEPVNGFMLAGLDAPSTTSRGFCHPPDLCQKLSQKFGPYIIEPGMTGSIVRGRPDQAVERLREELAQKEVVTQHLMQESPWDFFAVVFRSLDAVQHGFWKYMDPLHPQHDPAEAALYGKVILETYQQLDHSLGLVRSLLDDDTVLMVMSDHGFGRKHPANCQLNRWLASRGLLQFKARGKSGAGKQSWMTGALARAYRLLVANTPRGLKQMLVNWLPGLRNQVQSRLIYSNIDWPQTRAYSDTLFADIRINLQGREPLGTVAPGAEYWKLIDELREALADCRDSVTGKKIVDRVFHRDELYTGPCADRAPDLMIRWNQEDVIHGIALPGGEEDPAEASRPLIPGEDPRIISGDHKLYGVCMLAGKPIRSGFKLSRAHLSDLTPTILALMGLPVPDDMDGHVLTEAFREALQSVSAAAGAPQAANSFPAAAEPPPPSYSADEEAAVEQRLRDLGYIE